MIEEWKNIIGYNGKYQISNFGNVKSYKRYKEGKILLPTKDKDGYFQIGLRDENSKRKWYRIHRLVANAFISNPNKFTEINHKDNNPSNNKVDNLEWCTIEYNNKYRFTHGNGNNKGENGSCATLTNKEVKEIRKKWNTGKYKVKDLMKLFSSTRAVISGVINNKTYIDKNYIKVYDSKLNYTGEKSPHAILTKEKVLEIRSLYSNGNYTYKKLGKIFGVSDKTIEGIVKFRKWKNVS